MEEPIQPHPRIHQLPTTYEKKVVIIELSNIWMICVIYIIYACICMFLIEGVGCWGINDIPNEKSREMKRIWISKYVDKRVEVWAKPHNMGSLCYTTFY